MTERDWQKDWELCKKATPGPWKVSCLMGDTRIVATDLCGNSRGLVAKIPDGRHWPYSSTNAEFIAEAREALPYWLNQMLDVVMSLCHEGVMTMSRAREILGVTLHEADKLYAEWLKTYIEGK